MPPAKRSVIEAEATRDHTERMLRHFGAEVAVAMSGGKTRITVKGEAELQGRDVVVPADPSSAAFLAAAAALVVGSDITLEGVLVNPTRIGFYEVLREMGADVAFTERARARRASRSPTSACATPSSPACTSRRIARRA